MGPLCVQNFISLGVILFTLGLVVKFSLFPAILEAQVYEHLDIREGTEGYDIFVEPPVPIYTKFTLACLIIVKQNLILFSQFSNLHALIPSYMFIFFGENFPSILHDY